MPKTGFDKASRDALARAEKKKATAALRLQPPFPYAVKTFPLDFFGVTASSEGKRQ